MDDDFSIRGKRLRDTCVGDSEVENAQLKFSRLLETSRASHNNTSHPSPKELKHAALELIDDYQNFDGILRESDDGMLQQGNGTLDQLSLLAEDRCVAVLKSQASKAACPLDLLAPEILGKKLLQLLTVSTQASKKEQLLKASQLAPVNCILKVIKHLLAEQSFNRVCFTKHLTSKGHCLPLEVLWLLHANCIVSFSTYLACCLQQQETVKIFANALTALCSDFINTEKQENILSVVLGCLVRVSSLEKRTNKLEKVSQEILDAVVESIDFQAKEQTSDNSEKVAVKTRFCVLEIIRSLNDLPPTVLRKFFARQLNRLLAAQGEVEAVALYQAVANQRMWKISSLPLTTRTTLEQFLIIFDPPAVVESLKQAVFKEKVNWQNTLSFLSVFVVLVKEAASLIHGYVNNLINEALNNNDHYPLNVAFLLIRQLSLEGGHIFQPYISWFQSTFGGQGNPKLSSKRTVQFFMKFLTDLVPYEHAEYLKVHILRPPQVPAKLRVFVDDYTSLAKTRLLDLKEPVELIGHSGTGTHTENTKQLENASVDVKKVLETFEKTGKVPSTVMEASIFRKPYFVGRFIPALLLPRKIPDEPDARVQLIDVLNKAGKIPKKMQLAYQSACEKITSQQIDAVSSSSDDEGQLSSLERLGRSLDKVTKLIVESLKTAADTSQHIGRVSSQLSIVSANIQSAISILDGSEVTNQLVEFDVGSVVKDEIEPVSGIILNAFCQTYNAVKSCSVGSNESDKSRHQWAPNFVAMIASLPSLHKSIYQELWKKICFEGVSLNMDQINGLAAFLCHLSVHQNTMTPVLLKGTQGTTGNFHGDFTVCSYLDVLCGSVLIQTRRWMEFFVRFSCAYLEHAATAFDGNVTKVKSSVGDHTAYIPQALLKKMFYLFNRLNVNGESNFYKPTFSQDLVGLMNNVTFIRTFKELKGKEDRLSLSEWCIWELSISARDDFLPETARRLYQQFRVLDHFLPLGCQEGGCDGNPREACSVIFHALLDSQSSSTAEPCQGHETDVSRNDMIILLQELIPMLSARDGTACDRQGESLDPWLLEQLESRIEKIRFRVDDHQNNGNDVYNLQKSSEVALFMKLVVRLPPFLLFGDQRDALPDMRTIKRVATFINSDIRLYLSENCCLPFDVTVYVLKAGVSFSDKSLHGSRTASSSRLLSQLLADCPLFSVSLQHYWKQLKPLVLSHFDVQQGPLQKTELFFNWIIRVEKGLGVSIKELESEDACVLACCCFTALQKAERRIMTLFDTRTSPSTEFLSKVAVCLFDCIMSRFSDMILRGHQVTDTSHLRDLALRLVIQFPMTLTVFTCYNSSDFEEIQRLRSFVLKEQLIRLYPVVFFSFFSSLPREALQEVKSIDDFLRVTLRMYNAFVSLRKDCLEGVGNKSAMAISSPLHLDFCLQVSNFVRNCVLSSPIEHLKRLSEDVISSCTSELRQFLYSQLKKYPQR